jgi:hypothetical protein
MQVDCPAKLIHLKGQTLDKDSLNKYQWCFFGSAQINPRISRYEALKGSGKLDIV